MTGTLACCIWSGCTTSPNNYTAFVVSKWLGGTFGSVASTIGAGVILDTFFLHQRGKAFACYATSTLFGPQAGPTFGGFIVESAPWPVQFWWVIGVEGFVILLLFSSWTILPHLTAQQKVDPTETHPGLLAESRPFFRGARQSEQEIAVLHPG